MNLFMEKELLEKVREMMRSDDTELRKLGGSIFWQNEPEMEEYLHIFPEMEKYRKLMNWKSFLKNNRALLEINFK